MSLSPRVIHEIEQAVESTANHFCPAVWRIYRGFTEAGFPDDQALDLTKTWMMHMLIADKREDE